MKQAVLIPMVRSPKKGFVKRRLAADIGDEAALELYRSFVLDLMDSIGGIKADIMVGYFPKEDLGLVRDWLGGGLRFVSQSGKDLGERQASLLEQAFAMGYSRAAVMISDAPDIPVSFIDDAFMIMDSSDSVIGPCYDGGYYLIGFRREGFRPVLFSGMKWGIPSVSMEMKKQMTDSGLDHADIPPWWDIDSREDLLAFHERALKSGSGKRTISYIRSSGVLHEG
ncbi:MAG: TIGR04282 family arsenosugar biosynthesis glycosyltransferase [Thermoplasmatota archaeon]